MINDLELVDAISAIISKEALSIEEIQSRLLPIKVRKPTIKRILENEISYIEKKKKKGIYGDNIVFLYKKLSKTEYRNKKTPKRKKK